MRSLLFVALCGAAGSASALSCGDVILRNTVLDADLDCPASAAALVVGRSGVTLDLNGYTIRGGADTIGIELENVAGVMLRGPGRIVGVGTGVEATRANGLRVVDLDFVGVGDGVRLHNSSRGEVANNRFDGVAGHAVAVLALPYALTRGGNHAIHDNVVTHSEYGVLLDGIDSGGSIIAANRFAHIGTFAIQSDFEAQRSLIEDNDIVDVGVTTIVY